MTARFTQEDGLQRDKSMEEVSLYILMAVFVKGTENKAYLMGKEDTYIQTEIIMKENLLITE